jgi:hypothetical protein
MNLRLLVKGLLGCLLFQMAVALCAAVPPGLHPPAVVANETADDTANPYSVIVERNIFHLNPPPPPPEPEKPKVELPVLKITGIVDIGTQKKVLFLSEPKDKKEGPFYYSLVEGEKSADDKLELVKIHPSQDGVDVLNEGVAVTLTMKDDTLGASAAPAAAAAAAPAKEKPPGRPGNGMPGRQIRPGESFTPGNGMGFPARARRNLQ